MDPFVLSLTNFLTQLMNNLGLTVHATPKHRYTHAVGSPCSEKCIPHPHTHRTWCSFSCLKSPPRSLGSLKGILPFLLFNPPDRLSRPHSSNMLDTNAELHFLHNYWVDNPLVMDGSTDAVKAGA